MGEIITPRQIWLKNRVSEIIDSMKTMADTEDWKTYMQVASEIARELTYAVEEWEKYYND